MSEQDKQKQNSVSAEKPPKGKHTCGFCKATFPSIEDMYEHQSKEHDPDGIMFSDFGLPK